MFLTQKGLKKRLETSRTTGENAHYSGINDDFFRPDSSVSANFAPPAAGVENPDIDFRQAPDRQPGISPERE